MERQLVFFRYLFLMILQEEGYIKYIFSNLFGWEMVLFPENLSGERLPILTNRHIHGWFFLRKISSRSTPNVCFPTPVSHR
jgi:hypothetical protein